MDKKVIFIDLDGTLIDTESGETFPKGVWDMRILWDAWKALKMFVKENNSKYVVIVSNQGGILSGFVKPHSFNSKFSYIQYALEDYLGIPVFANYCPSDDVSDKRRKPNTGMLEKFSYMAPKSEMIMIGDASGKPNDFSDTDKKTAENFGIDYMDVIELILRYTVKT